MRAQYLPLVIFSVDKSNLSSIENSMRQRQVENDMHHLGIHYTKVLGSYKGSEEMSYMVTDMTKIELIRGIAKVFEQESILLRDNENRVTLQYFNGQPSESIGFLENVMVDEALTHDSWTYIPTTKQYYVVK